MARTSLRPLLGSQTLWLVLGIVVATAWFGSNTQLPPLFRGERCCDAAEYSHMADSKKLAGAYAVAGGSPTTTHAPTPSLFQTIATYLFADTGYRTIGYPVFLAAHRYGLLLLHLSPFIAWQRAATISALFIHFFSCWFFYRTVRRAGFALHPVALFLLLTYPSLVSHAALTLTDTLTASLLLIGLSLIWRSNDPDRNHPWLSLLAGSVLGYAVMLRPSNHLPVLLTLIVWMACRAWKAKRRPALLLSPILALAACLFVLSPRYISCSKAAGTLCFLPPANGASVAQEYVTIGLDAGRVYSVLWGADSSRIVTVSDPFILSHFRSRCTIGRSAVKSLGLCLFKELPFVPLFTLKKSIELFDHYQISSYATYVTPAGIFLWNRSEAVLAYVGFMCLLLWSVVRLFQRSLSPQLVPILAYLFAYTALSLPLAIESRYGLPLVPFGIAAALLLIQSLRPIRRHILQVAFFLSLALFYIVQTSVWDRLDPIKYRSIDASAAENAEPPVGLLL